MARLAIQRESTRFTNGERFMFSGKVNYEATVSTEEHTRLKKGANSG
jgi:hypothetical protein